MVFFGFFGASILLVFFKCDMLRVLLNYAGALLFGVYVVLDTQMIVGGRRKQFTIDDYILGALMLYIDIVQLFLYILSILGSDRN